MSSLDILVVDDEAAIRQVLASQLRKAGHMVNVAPDSEGAVAGLMAGAYDVCLCDMRLPDASGVEVMRRARSAGLETLFIMMTAYASVSDAIEAMKLGAHDYLVKPLRSDDLLHRLVQVEDMLGLREENRRLRSLVEEPAQGIWGHQSRAMRDVELMVEKVARSDGTVLITGESGTGKSHVARMIHERSRRADRAFVSVNCGAIPENLLESEFFGHSRGAFTGADKARKGLFREADGGTLFLDEICELPVSLQVKLLHVLEEKEVRPVGSEQSHRVDARIITATNRDVQEMVSDGSFREDLYYRLNVLHLRLPPLRERGEDLPALIRYFVHRETHRLGTEREFRIDPMAEEILCGYAWPGNLRELQNIIARAVVLADGDTITIADLPSQVSLSDHVPSHLGPLVDSAAPLREQVRNFEVRLIRQAIADSGGDRQEAARRLGIGLSTLYRKLEEYESRGDARSEPALTEMREEKRNAYSS